MLNSGSHRRPESRVTNQMMQTTPRSRSKTVPGSLRDNFQGLVYSGNNPWSKAGRWRGGDWGWILHPFFGIGVPPPRV